MKKILVLCFGLLILLSAGCGGSKKVSGSSPEAVAQAYYDALKNGKYEEAYEYRKFNPPKTKDQFVKERQSSGMVFKEFSIGKATIKGDTATVPVKFKTGSPNMPELSISITLVNDKGWKITSTMGGGGGMGSGMPPGGSTPSTTPPAAPAPAK